MQGKESESETDNIGRDGTRNNDESGERSLDWSVRDEDDLEPSFDWIVFLLRASALLAVGAMLITSIDLSRNQGAEWLTVMRLAILPFVGAMLLLAAAELIDRRGD